MEAWRGLSVDTADLPGDALLVELDHGPAWRYEASGIANLYVCGGLANTEGYDGWFHFKDLQGLHDLIGDTLLRRSVFTGEAFRFLRKEMSLTVGDSADLLGLPVAELASWECGGAGVPGSDAIKAFYLRWRTDGVRPIRAPTATSRH
jgi:hypothetical protein